MTWTPAVPAQLPRGGGLPPRPLPHQARGSIWTALGGFGSGLGQMGWGRYGEMEAGGVIIIAPCIEHLLCSRHGALYA